MMTELATCIKCGAEIEKETWVSEFGFCTSQHYVEYMTEHRLWSEGDKNYSQEHMDKILERTEGIPPRRARVEDIPEGRYTLYDIDKLSWLDTFIKVEWALIALDILYFLLS